MSLAPPYDAFSALTNRPEISPFALGATLYMPATRPDLLDWATGHGRVALRSLVICLEDAVAENQTAVAMANLRKLLPQINAQRSNQDRPYLFLRPRNLAMAKECLAWAGISGITGFVAPKVTPDLLPLWCQLIAPTHLYLMPTLETAEYFDPQQVIALRDEVLTQSDRVLMVRIGGNDLLASIGLRRAPTGTVYQGPLAYAMSMFSSIFGAANIALSAPVFEHLNQPDLLTREATEDANYGFVGKTAVHPEQVPAIERAFAVTPTDYRDAQTILAAEAAVFRHAGRMCEPATHQRWSQRTMQRAEQYGVC